MGGIQWEECVCVCAGGGSEKIHGDRGLRIRWKKGSMKENQGSKVERERDGGEWWMGRYGIPGIGELDIHISCCRIPDGICSVFPLVCVWPHPHPEPTWSVPTSDHSVH